MTMVRSRGLEPPRVAPLAPQASASTNSATTAYGANAPWPARDGADVTVRPCPDKARAGRSLRSGSGAIFSPPNGIGQGIHTRRNLTIGLLPAAGSPPVEWPVHVAGRGGQFTYHGPGQRVGYVMLDLKRRAPDVRRFVATIEEWIIRTLAAFGVRGERRDDRIGVWVRRPEKGEDAEGKIAAIGIRIQRWVTLHGFAINVAPDLSHFSGIVPCGISDPRHGVTSLADLDRRVSMARLDGVLRAEFERLFGATADAQLVSSIENSSPRRRSASSSSVPSR
jgi:lipoate-protein ligase B